MPDEKSVAPKHNNSASRQLQLALDFDPPNVAPHALQNLEALSVPRLEPSPPERPGCNPHDHYRTVPAVSADLTPVNFSEFSTHWTVASDSVRTQTAASFSFKCLWRGLIIGFRDLKKGLKNQLSSGI